MRILIVKLSSFGDVIHTFPAVTDLVAGRPDIEIEWLVEEDLAPMATLHPAVRAVYPVAYRRLRWPPNRWPGLFRHLLSLRRELRARRYDLVVDAQGLFKSAVLARLAGAPVSGYDRASAREPVATWLYRRRFFVARDTHAVERTRRLLAEAAGYPRPEGTGQFRLTGTRHAPAGIGLPARYGLFVHSASWPTKLWPEDRWRRLITDVAANGGAVVLPWGSGEERARAERLAAGTPAALVLPRVLSGTELADLVAGADYAVGLDSGLMHLAAAHEVPGVWLFGPTDPTRTGPYGGGQIVVRSPYREAPCLRRRCDREPGGTCCMSAIAYERVLAAIDEMNRLPAAPHGAEGAANR